jgi:hypothetical protein
MANEIYNTSWWGTALDTARTAGTNPDFFGSQMKLLTSEQDNLVTNGDFSEIGTPNTSSWALGWYSPTNNVIISDGKLTMTNSASESDARAYATNGTSSNNILTTNKFYKLQYDIVSNNGVTDFKYYSEAGAFISVPSVEVGSYTIYIRNTSNSLFLFQNATSNSSISIDNVSVQLVRCDLDQIEAKKCLADWIHTTALKDLNN